MLLTIYAVSVVPVLVYTLLLGLFRGFRSINPRVFVLLVLTAPLFWTYRAILWFYVRSGVISR